VVSRAEMPALAGAVERLPALSASRDRLERAAAGDGALADLVRIVESDVALGVAVLRLANRGPRRRTVASLADAVRVAGPARLRALAEGVPVADPLSRDPDDRALERFRLHALAVQAAMDRVAPAAGHVQRDELLTAALLHDIGKLALGGLDLAPEESPEARIETERAEHGTDHAEVGGDLARRMAFPDRLAVAIADHHRATSGPAGLVRLADMLALYAQGRIVDLDCLVEVSARAGLERTELGRLMYELPQPAPSTRRALQPCPLSTREIEVLECLSEGQLYKQIGARLGLSTSTVRSHLHRIYTRMGVVDRTQAVLLARESGWI
jgi:putative nucleotidyltransferase with HDIG domain